MEPEPPHTPPEVIADLKWRKEWIPEWRGTEKDIPPSQRPTPNRSYSKKHKRRKRPRVAPGTYPPRTCEDCGQDFDPTGKYGLYCGVCRRTRWKQSARQREQRGIERN